MTFPETDQLRCFVAAAEALHFRRAAHQVHLTPAALGKQISNLEERLKVSLFLRTTRAVALTAAGQALLPKASSALAALAKCTSGGLEAQPPMGEITMGSRHELALSWVLPWISHFSKLEPLLRIHLYIGSGDDLLNRVRMGMIDCAVTSARFSDVALQSEPLHEETYEFVASPRLLKKLPLKKPADARKHCLIDTSRELPLFHYWKDSCSLQAPLIFDHTWHLGTISAIKECVVKELGVAVLPTYFIQRELKAGTLVRVFKTLKATSDFFRLVYRASDHRQEIFKTLATHLRQWELQ